MGSSARNDSSRCVRVNEVRTRNLFTLLEVYIRAGGWVILLGSVVAGTPRCAMSLAKLRSSSTFSWLEHFADKVVELLFSFPV